MEAQKQQEDFGKKVRLTRDVERFPHFIAKAGLIGRVVQADPYVIAVKMDEPLPGAEEWDNEVCWYAEMDENQNVATAFESDTEES